MEIEVNIRATATVYWDFDRKIEVPDDASDSVIYNKVARDMCNYVGEEEPFFTGYENLRVKPIGKREE